MNELGELSRDEIDLVTRFRNGDPLDRARIVLATHKPMTAPTERENIGVKIFRHPSGV